VSEPLVSIVVDNYNYARFLPAAIDSALAQRHPRTEVLVVDDGSTDGSLEVIRSYGDRISAVVKENGGQASALNAGFARSRGDIVIFLDADDVLLPTAAESAVERLGGSNAVKVHWPLWEVDEEGSRTGETVPPRGRELSEGELRALAIREGPKAYEFPPGSGNAWTRDFCREVLPMPEREFRDFGDAYLLALAPLVGPIERVVEPQALYRVHGANREGGHSRYRVNELILEAYDAQCAAMGRYLQAQGVSVDPETWKDGNPHYSWRRSLQLASEELLALLPAGETFVLVDDDEWNHHWGTSEVVPGRYATPFPERGGRYWGLPADDASAIEELERLSRAGRRYIVFGWTAFWWLEHYAGFHRHLRSRHRCVHESEHLVAFDLQSAPDGSPLAVGA
jgi:glycosyltransferase involved in cell wall biosynthesis